MRKMKNKILTKSFLLFGAAAALLLTSTVGSTRAALTYRSENYEMQIEVPSIGVSLLENGQEVSRRNYIDNNEWNQSFGDLLSGNLKYKGGEDEKLVLGKTYTEELTVRNSGTIESYVRAIVYRNWIKEDGETANTELSPDLIEMDLTGRGWIVDKDASTPERTVLYYSQILPVNGTTAFNNTLRINPSIGQKVTETKSGNTVRTEFAYNGYKFNIKVEVDAVQTHNAVEAIRSAWGVDVTVGANGDLTLQRGGTGAVVQ